MKSFNTTGICVPERHYMVDLTERLREIKAMVDAGQYFTINRARQYGKSTTLSALRRYLVPQYEVIRLDFQGIGSASFETEERFVQSLSRLLRRSESAGVTIPVAIAEAFEDFLSRSEHCARLDELFGTLTGWCRIAKKPLVLMIDEVDSATNNQVFLDFLAQLRDGYISRDDVGSPAFQSVILAGVTDIKNLRRKLRPEEQHRFNSPWNIAADFTVDMSLSTEGICGMLADYEADHTTGMDTAAIARELRAYTNGYPYLVSRICQVIDTQISGKSERFSTGAEAWTISGVAEAVRRMLQERNTLFDSLMGKVESNPELSALLERILFSGERVSYTPYSLPVMDGEMYGFLRRTDDSALAIANRIFETLLYDYYLSLNELKALPVFRLGSNSRETYIRNGRLDLDALLEHYITVFHDIYGDQDESFSEAEGRRRFLLFLRPVINGTGNYYIEAQTRNSERMDLVIDYLGERFVIELKLWRGQAYHEKGERQLAEYLDSYHLSKGYLLTYSFNKNKTPGLHRVVIDGKELVEVMV